MHVSFTAQLALKRHLTPHLAHHSQSHHPINPSCQTHSSISAQPNNLSTTPHSLASNSSTAKKSFAFLGAGLKSVIKHRQRDLGDVGGWILGKGGAVYACGEGRRWRDLGQWRER
ncbi:hypothetical protein PRUPE_6G141000 [Prunus persica]|uniref:Uncharacterized protein n=1 Tax=Prunus persica TaxID=3760 RepID=A0A251NT07_PRUPE|nr:hypothetical protein PRUPE_6G141000 [Prunus persica]